MSPAAWACYARAMTPSTTDYLQLISLAVHEIRTPASVVGGYLRMLQGGAAGPLNDKQRHMIEEAEKSCARLVGIVAELSDVEKLDDGRAAFARRPVDVFALIGEVAELVQEARERHVRLELQGPATGAPLTGDADRLKRAFDAIFRAILREKAGPCTVIAERRLEIRDGRECAIVVVAESSSVLSVYKRTPGLFDDHRGGLGLALPLARRTIEGHGGTLTAPAPVEDHDPLSRGSAVITLPVT
jgi:signal transduction histidine kinase